MIQDGVQNYAGHLYDELSAISIGSDLDGADYFSLSATGELTVNGLTAFVVHSNQILSLAGLAEELTIATEGYTPLTCTQVCGQLTCAAGPKTQMEDCDAVFVLTQASSNICSQVVFNALPRALEG